MARNIQSQGGGEANIKAVFGLLANAVFWLIVAIAVPVRDILSAVPQLGPYAHWAPILFYALAFWCFIRAVRVLPRLAVSRTSSLLKRGPTSAAQAPRAGSARPAKSGSSALVVNRPPTVQRMR